MSDETTREDAPKRTRRIGPNVALAAGSFVLALLLGEIVLRLFGIGLPPRIEIQESADLYRPSAVAGLNYELRPGFDGHAYGAPVRINSLGMRGPATRPGKPAGTLRVLILGDSVAFGHGVAYEECFAARLADLLSTGTLPVTKVEMLDAAVPGYNSEQQSIAMREQRLALDPDIVVVVATINDAEPAYRLGEAGNLAWEQMPAVYRDTLEQALPRKGLDGFLQRHLRLYSVLRTLAHRPYMISKSFFDYTRELYAESSPGWQSMREALKSMQALCRKRGIAFLLVFSPTPARPEPEAFQDVRKTLSTFAESAEIDYYDLHEALGEQAVARYTISPMDRHPNALGHRLIAEALARPIRSALEEVQQRAVRSEDAETTSPSRNAESN